MLIRRRVVVASVLVFVLVWVVIFAQLVAGRDPALAGKESSRQRAEASRAAILRERRAARRRHERAVRRARRRAEEQALVDGTPPPVQAAPLPAPEPAPAPPPVTTQQS